MGIWKMNEQKLKELWWKARIGYNEQNCDPEVLAKFAELIVQECVSVAMEQYDDAEPWGGVREVLKHFGVE